MVGSLLKKREQCAQPADGAAGDEDEDDRDDGDDDEDDGRPDVAQLQRVQLGVAVSLKRVKGSITASFSQLSKLSQAHPNVEPQLRK